MTTTSQQDFLGSLEGSGLDFVEFKCITKDQAGVIAGRQCVEIIPLGLSLGLVGLDWGFVCFGLLCWGLN